jgi:hypothetical protein
VIAFSLKDPAKHDMIRFTDRFRVTSGSLNIFVSKFFLSNTAQDMVSARFEVYDQRLRPIEFSVLEVPDSGMLAKSCVIIFARPLTAGGPGRNRPGRSERVRRAVGGGWNRGAIEDAAGSQQG